MSERPLYLSGDGFDGVFAVLHSPPSASPLRPVLLLAPFGWEDMCSYRSRREWARHLAAGGRSVLRIDLPGSGDSAGDPRADRLAAQWLAAVGGAARWLAGEAGSAGVTAIGIGLGGLLACLAAADGAPIDELVLWNVPRRGRAIVRAARAAAALEAARRGRTPPADGDESVAATGYVLAPATVAELGRLEVGALPARRALLLGRDGISVDETLAGVLGESGVEVEVADGPGYAQMTIEPQDARPPLRVFERVDEWLAGESAPLDGTPPASGITARERLELDGFSERPVQVESPSGPLFAILASPAERSGDLAVLFLNAGPQRRIGPNRMWVEAARRWAAAGVPSLRVDLTAIGDTPGDASALARIDAFYNETYVAEARAALDAAAALGPASRLMVVGLCAGCYWAANAALDDGRVAALALLNPSTLAWDPGVTGMRRARELRRMMGHRSSWARLLHGDVTPAKHLETARAVAASAFATARRHGGPHRHPATTLFDGLRDRGRRGTIVFTSDEALQRELTRQGDGDLAAWPNLTLVQIDTGVEAHTLVPPDAQRRVHEALDATLAGAAAQGRRDDGAAASASAIWSSRDSQL